MTNKNEKFYERQQIFKAIKPFFIEKIGKFTHQKLSKDWHFRGLAFVRDDMTYVFGFNIGFFREDDKTPENEYDHVGANVLVRTNGLNPLIRNKYKDFFEEYLQKWILKEKDSYSSFRGGVGTEFPRILPISEFKNNDEIIDFLKNSISQLSEVLPYIATNPDDIFSHVVRGNPPWDETIIELALKKSSNIYKS